MMINVRPTRLIPVAFAALTVSLVACGGGGGGSGGGTGGGGGTIPVAAPSTSPTQAPTATPTPTLSPTDTGSVAIGAAVLANAPVVFTCGCTGEGGMTRADASGNYTITVPATAIPSSPTPYTPPGHNLVVVGYSTTSNAQAWTMVFLGNSSATNLNLSASPSSSASNTTDAASTAVALYAYYQANYSTAITGTDRTFDWFNFNTLIAYAQHLRTAPTAHEQALLSDIAAQQGAGASLFPGYTPTWNENPSAGVNAIITADVRAIAMDSANGSDAAAPTPCPAAGQCTGAPTP